MPRKATPEDYINLQGGIPQVQHDKGGLWHITHNYDPKDPLIVRTHISPEARGIVLINGVEYQTALLRRFEGDPCEIQSIRIGGARYERKG